MSPKAVSVCTNCRRSSKVSIKCTKCLRIFCATCFYKRNNAQALCPKCINGGNGGYCSTTIVKTEPVQDKFSTESTTRELCKLHRKDCKLYCTQCHVAICGLCIDEGQPHELHHIDNYSIVYQEKVLEMNRKLDQAQKHVESMGVCSVVYGWNLKMLEREEAGVLKEIERMTESSKLTVTRMTSIRKKRLRAQLQIPVEHGKIMTEARDSIKNSTVDMFMQNLQKLDEMCTKLAAAPPEIGVFCLETADDIECDLVPAYKIVQFTAVGLFQADNSISKFTLAASYDIIWNVTLMKSDKIRIKVSHSDPELLKFPHKLVVIIPHPHSQEEIRQTFEPRDNDTIFDVVQMSRLVLLGFQKNNSDDLVLKIGIRPDNAVVEKRLLTYRYEQEIAKKRSIQLSLTAAELKLSAITERKDYNHHCMYFVLNMSQVSNYWEQSSFQTVDPSGRQWRLNVYPYNQIGAYIEMCKGKPTKLSYFVELIHSEPNLTLVGSSQSAYANLNEELGWNCFITWKKLVKDTGFYPNGVLRFRFGVRPLSS